MARPLRIEYPGAYYHVTSRGNERKAIFWKKGDRKGFLQYLKSAYLRYGAVIHAYCLMSNHYHLLIETPKGNLSQIMRHINGAYTTYFNVKHKRKGHLFQGRYKAILVEADTYAAELSRYIHLNPVRAKMAERPEESVWSSYRYYIGKKKKPQWLSTDTILNYFESADMSADRSYADFVLARVIDGGDNPLEKTVASTVLGSEDFIEKVVDTYLGHKENNRDQPSLRELKKIDDIEHINKEAKAQFGADSRISKKVSIYICHQYSGKTLQDIGEYFGISESAVTLTSQRLMRDMRWNMKLKRDIYLIMKSLNL